MATNHLRTRTRLEAKIRELGLLATGRLIVKRVPGMVRHPVLQLRWHRLRREYYRANPAKNSGNVRPTHFVDPEGFIREILRQRPGQSFLEIGIGEFPNIDRLRVVAEHDLAYTACDFTDVCDTHEGIIRTHQDLDVAKLRFLRNGPAETYSWNLFELLRQNEQFDIIYLDGHHTFYVDCPALMLAHLLLKPGGVFLLDDITWTLEWVQSELMKSFAKWKFNKRMYDFSRYDERQRRLAHVGIMAQAILLDRLHYSKMAEYSTPHWWALRKPDA